MPTATGGQLECGASGMVGVLKAELAEVAEGVQEPLEHGGATGRGSVWAPAACIHRV